MHGHRQKGLIKCLKFKETTYYIEKITKTAQCGKMEGVFQCMLYITPLKCCIQLLTLIIANADIMYGAFCVLS